MSRQGLCRRAYVSKASFVLLSLCWLLSCKSTPEQAEQDDFPPLEIFDEELESFSVGSDDEFLNNSFTSDSNAFGGEDDALDFFDNFDQRNSFVDDFDQQFAESNSFDDEFALGFNQSPEEVNSSLFNDTQEFGDFQNDFPVDDSDFFVDNFVDGSAGFDDFSGNSFAQDDVFDDFSSDPLGPNDNFIDDNFMMDMADDNQPFEFNEVQTFEETLAFTDRSAPEAEFDEFMAFNDSQKTDPDTAGFRPSQDVLPTLHVLTWVGYELDKANRELKIEMITRGNPEFLVYQEVNQAQQPELVFRFLQTSLRRKVRWDIDASEFRSPVAYVRMRVDRMSGFVDVVLTLRDAVKPQFFAKEGNIELKFKVPDRYFGNQMVAERDPIDRAQKLNNVQLVLDVIEGSELPTVSSSQGMPTSAGSNRDRSDFRPIDNILQPPPMPNYDENGLPPSFEATFHLPNQNSLDFALSKVFPPSHFHLTAMHHSAIAQDDFDDFGAENFDFGGDDGFFLNSADGEASENGENSSDLFGSEFNDFSSGASDEFPMNSPFVDPVDESFDSGPDLFGEGGSDNFGIDAVSDESFNFTDQFETQGSNDPATVGDNFFFDEMNLSDAEVAFSDEFNNGFNDLAVDQDIQGLEPGSRGDTKYGGRPIYMEFTDAPLSIVFKTFSAETKNNFVFPNEVGELPITIHFQGVPWDEALQAILETHSLGMVRVGNNIVRVDGIEKLTEYMQKLEQAKEFESRRVPTKVLVMRLNNAKSEDVIQRLDPILERDREIDPRVRITADERTNSIIMEAPEYLLSKIKNVIERLDLVTPQVEIASRIVEIQKTNRDAFGMSWLNQPLASFDPGRGLGFGSLNFPNSFVSTFAVDPGIRETPLVGNAQFRLGSINRFINLDLVLRMEERRGTTNILQSNRLLVLDGQPAQILSGSSRFFRPAAGGTVVNQGDGGGGGADQGLAEVTFNLSLSVTPQVTADGSVIMDLNIVSDTPSDPTGEVLADKNTRELSTQMVRESGDTGVIGGITDTSRVQSITGIPFFSRLPILGALFRSTITEESQTELLIMVTPTIQGDRRATESARMVSSSFESEDIFGDNVNSFDPFDSGGGESFSDFDNESFNFDDF